MANESLPPLPAGFEPVDSALPPLPAGFEDASAEPESFLGSVKRRLSEQLDLGLEGSLRAAPAQVAGITQSGLRGVASGLSALGGSATFLGGIPGGLLVDALTGGRYGLADRASAATEAYFADADRYLQNDPLATNPENQLAAGAGRVGVDLINALATRGAGAEAQAVARPTVGRLVEEAVEQGARASLVPSLTRGSELATDVIDAGGTPLEAAGAGAAGASANTLAFMLPGAATGRLPVRAVTGAAAEVPAGYLQQQVENLALPDRLGLDQEYGAREAFMDALLGGGLAAATGSDAPAPARVDESMPPLPDGYVEVTASEAPAAPAVDVPAPVPPQPAAPDVVETAAAAAPPPVQDSPEPAPARTVEPTAEQVGVDADTGRGTYRLIDEVAPDGTDYSEFGQVRRVTAYDGETPVGTLVYANDGTPPTVEVEPEYQRRGIATAMYELARQQGGVLGGAEGIRGRGAEYRTPAGMAFRTGADASRITLAPARPSAVQSAGAPPSAVTPQAEPATVDPLPTMEPAAVARTEPASPAPAPEGVIRSAVRSEPGVATPAPPAVTQPPAVTGGGSTGTKNRVTDAERTAESRDPIVREMRRSNAESVSRAETAMAENPNLVDELVARASGESISATEEAAMLIGKVRERNRREEAAAVVADPKASPERRAAAQRQWDEAEAAINRIDEANVARGREWGRLGQFRQRLMAADFTLEAMESKLRRAKGEALTQAETAGLRDLADRLKTAETDLETARAKIAEYEQSVIVRQTIEQAVREATAQMRGQRGGRSKLDVLKERADAARKRLDSSYAIPDKKGQSGSVINPAALIADVLDIGIYHVANGAKSLGDWIKAMTADLGERFTSLQDRWPDLFAASRRAAAPAKPDAPTTAEVLAAIDPANVTREDVRDLVMARIRAGEKDADAIMKAVTADVQAVAPEATEADVRQLFADYGKRASPTRDADQQTLRDLRAVVRLEREIADAEAGLPRKAPRARRQATEAVRQLRARLSELLKQAGRRARTPEAEAVLLAKRRDVLEKQIADLGEQVETGRRPPAGTPRLTPEQLKDLTDQRDRLRNRIRWLDREAKKAAEAPAKAAAAAKQRENDRLNLIDGLNAQAERIQAQIDGGYREIPKSTQKVMDAGVAEARRKLAEAKEARREVDRQTFADEIAAAKAEKRRADLSEQIADLEDMLRTGRRPEKRDRTESNPDLAARRDELQREIRRVDAAMRPRRSPEEVYQQRRGTSIEREIERIQARLSAGDYARSPRVPKALNEANKAAALRLEELRAEFKLKQFDYEMNNSGWMKRVGGYAAQALHLQRAIQTSYDLSGIGRQGVFSLFGHPIRTAKAIPEMLRAAGSREERLASEEDIKSRENAPLYKKYRLPINDSTLNRTEEVFTSRWLEKLRLKHKEGEAGKNAARLVVNAPLEITRGSERAYATVLNRLRADAFDAFHAFLSEGGRPITDRQGQIISDFVAATTGRSNVPLKVEGLANGLNLVYFAARLVWSRFQVLYGHHVWMAALNGEWRAARFMAQEYGRVAGAMALFYALATAWYVGSGEEEEDEKKGDRRPFIDRDPRSSAFGQLRFGDHYINPTGGLSQAATFMARMMTGETVTGSGETVRLSDDPSRSLSNKLASLAPVFRKYGLDDLADAMPEQNTEKRSPMAADFGDVLARFNRTKLSPVFGAGWDWITGEDFMGQPTTTAEILANMMLPMTIGTPWQAFQTESPGKAAGLTLSEIGGWAVQHWDRAALEAPDQATMSPEQRAKYNEYLRVTGNMKQDLDAIRDLANSFPEDTSAADVRDAVQMRADQLGLDGVTLKQYSRNTTARNERGLPKTGLQRSESGGVKMEYAKGSTPRRMLDAEETINGINKRMEDILRRPMTDDEINKVYREFVADGDADGDKMLVIRQLRDQRDQAMREFMDED